MTIETMLKLGQIAGALLMAAGVAACVMKEIQNTPGLMLAGGVLYGGCRLAAWLRKKD